MNNTTQASIVEATDLLKVISSKTRFAILSLLLRHRGNICVQEIAEEIGKSHSATSHQLAKLEDKGLVESTRHGQTVCYRLKDCPECKKVKAIIKNINHA